MFYGTQKTTVNSHVSEYSAHWSISHFSCLWRYAKCHY